jgi:hypothetical protein
MGKTKMSIKYQYLDKFSIIYVQFEELTKPLLPPAVRYELRSDLTTWSLVVLCKIRGESCEEGVKHFHKKINRAIATIHACNAEKKTRRIMQIARDHMARNIVAHIGEGQRELIDLYLTEEFKNSFEFRADAAIVDFLVGHPEAAEIIRRLAELYCMPIWVVRDGIITAAIQNPNEERRNLALRLMKLH